jgi:hypothetical protein
MTDIFMGDRTYPHDFKDKVKQKLKVSLFWLVKLNFEE